MQVSPQFFQNLTSPMGLDLETADRLVRKYGRPDQKVRMTALLAERRRQNLRAAAANDDTDQALAA